MFVTKTIAHNMPYPVDFTTLLCNQRICYILYLEWGVASVDSDRDGTDGGDSTLEVHLAAFFDIDITSVCGSTIGWLVVASTVLRKRTQKLI